MKRQFHQAGVLLQRRFAITGAKHFITVALCAVTLAIGASRLKAAETAGTGGGLCVQVGAEKIGRVTELAASGRFLVQVLETDEQLIDQARRRLHTEGLDGLVSVERLPESGRLPYTENLVNLLIVTSQESARLSLGEASRVLCPNGRLMVAKGKQTAEQLQAAGFVDASQSDAWLTAGKPRPLEMDEWSHPRHSAAGNAASNDSLVGPPRRVRWVAGATAEVRGMVSAGGRNFNAGVLARDGFNGLRLWNLDLTNGASGDDFVAKNLGGQTPPPITDGKCVYAVQQKKLLALDAATGETVREYPDAGVPRTVLLDRNTPDGGTLIVVSSDSVRALDVESAKLKWTFSASAPRYVVAGDDTVALIVGNDKRAETIEAVVLDMQTGEVRWRRADLDWLPKVKRTVYHKGVVAFEVSTLNNDGPGNALHIVDAADGRVRFDHAYLPGANHNRQARAIFMGDWLWLLHGGKDANKKRLPVKVSALDMQTGKVLVTHPAGLTHCFPHVMTCRYMISGEMDLTDLRTGQLDANRITKAACGRDGGWVPANGLIYATPKHCVCWPMVRGFTAMAPKRPGGDVADMDVAKMDFPLQRGAAPPSPASAETAADWPCYRHDSWRSGSTPAAAPTNLKPLWSVDLGGKRPSGPIVADWRENCFVKGPVTAPTIAGNRVIVARPDAHEVVAMDAASGSIAWRFTANGRVDTPPTVHKGLCLFGAKSGRVYCLRADDGRLVWQRRVAPLEEQIVAYGQLESPWPVPGSVLVIDDVAYFAAGRQSLADGGIFIFAVEPASGKINWVRRLNSVPQTNFYDCSSLEFDNFDLLNRQGDGLAMSRWVFDRKTGQMSLDRWAAFAKLNTGGGAAMVPQGCWSYAPRHQRRIKSYAPLRPLVVFRDNRLFGSLQQSSTLYRREFNLDGGEKFDTRWMTGWAASELSRKGKMPWRSHRLAEKAAWKVDVFGKEKDVPTIDAMVLAADRLFVAGSDGDLRVLNPADGKLIAKQTLPEPLWDGMAIAAGRLYYSTRDGQILCLGD